MACSEIEDMVVKHFLEDYGMEILDVPKYVHRFVTPLCYACTEDKKCITGPAAGELSTCANGPGPGVIAKCAKETNSNAPTLAPSEVPTRLVRDFRDQCAISDVGKRRVVHGTTASL